MKIVMTGPHKGATSNLMYCDEDIPGRGKHAFGMCGTFRLTEALSFTKISGYPANANYAPEGMGGAITDDLGLDFLFRIAGAR